MIVTQEKPQEAKEQASGKRQKMNRVELTAPGNSAIKKVTGGFIFVPGVQRKPYVIDLRDDQKLHFIPATNRAPDGYVIQPSGGPTLSAKGVSSRINRTINWIHVLTRRGPLDPLGGLQGYLNTGSGWFPKIGAGVNGAEIMYYEEDLRAWAKVYAPPAEQEEDLTELIKMDVPDGIRMLFYKFGNDELLRTGYVTRTRVIALAKLASRYARFEEYYREDPTINPNTLAAKLAGTDLLGSEELEEHYNLYKPITDRNYIHLQAVAAKEQWRDNPKKLHNTSSYRRKPRNI